MSRYLYTRRYAIDTKNTSKINKSKKDIVDISNETSIADFPDVGCKRFKNDILPYF